MNTDQWLALVGLLLGAIFDLTFLVLAAVVVQGWRNRQRVERIVNNIGGGDGSDDARHV